MIDIPQILKTKTLDQILEISKSIQDRDTRYLLLGSAFLKYKKYNYAYDFLKHIRHKYPRLFSYSAFYLNRYDEVVENLKSFDDVFDLIVLTISYLNLNRIDDARQTLNRAMKIDRKRTLELLKQYVMNSPQTPYTRALLTYIDQLMNKKL
ncbi:MAG: hypothetical protein NZ908_00465 [Candidatus Micrarchaeota archaeon]|nr:hypothetical protein [Candidatus Micrarchaeota archaeon]MCX8154560.1 hypothetical protein [Candidatus Micrarchaeota archaeon]